MPPKQYIVVREWTTARRTHRIAAGPFPTRAKAQRFADKHRHMLIYESTIAVALFRQLDATGNYVGLDDDA